MKNDKKRKVRVYYACAILLFIGALINFIAGGDMKMSLMWSALSIVWVAIALNEKRK